jgi:hypothetical protein
MAQTVYGLTRDNGDGSNGMCWFRNKEIVDRILDEDDSIPGWVMEPFYGNEGMVNMTLTFPDDLDLVQCGFRFSDDQYG